MVFRKIDANRLPPLERQNDSPWAAALFSRSVILADKNDYSPFPSRIGARMFKILIDNPLLLLFLVAAIGYPLGRLKICGSSLGVAAVLFVGLAMIAGRGLLERGRRGGPP